MRIPLVCNVCLGITSVTIEPTEGGQIYLADLCEDDQYVHTCVQGHTIATTLHNRRFDVLFEAGAVALLCGFHREAVTSFATALERFYEFSMRVIARHLNLSEVFEDTWKHMPKESERQFGAFVSMYAVAFKQAYSPAADARRVTELRNAVVHKGEIPTSDAAKKHGDRVYRIIRKIDDELAIFNDAYLEFVWRRTYDKIATFEAELKKSNAATTPTRLYIETMLSRTTGEDTFEAQLADLRARIAMVLRNPLVAASRRRQDQGPWRGALVQLFS